MVKERSGCECPFGSSSSDGFVEPKQCRLQAPVAVAESTLALDGWRTGDGTHSKVETRSDVRLRYDGLSQTDLDGSKRHLPAVASSFEAVTRCGDSSYSILPLSSKTRLKLKSCVSNGLSYRRSLREYLFAPSKLNTYTALAV